MTDPCPRPDCVVVRAELEAARAARTLGGVPRPSTSDWANATLPPPPSADDPEAPQHRRVGMVSSRHFLTDPD